jgi:peptide/nickel transport system permease protein
MTNRRFLRRPMALASMAVICAWIVLAVAAPFLFRDSPSEPDLFAITQAPSARHWLGTDELGRDVLTRVAYGARTSLTVGVLAAALSTLLGMLVGVGAGSGSPVLDAVLMRVTDVFLCVPHILVLMLVFALMPPTPILVIVFLGLTGWMAPARILRNMTLSLRRRDFVEAARAAGMSTAGIARAHVLPNIASTIIVSATLAVAYNMVAEGTLSFLGYGISSTTPSWGNMLTSAQSLYLQAPQLTLVPGFALMMTVLAFNTLGDVLANALALEQRGY